MTCGRADRVQIITGVNYCHDNVQITESRCIFHIIAATATALPEMYDKYNRFEAPTISIDTSAQA